MSTLTYAKPHRSSRRTGTQGRTGTPRARIVSGRLALVFLSEFCALTSFYLLLSVTPMYAAAAGAGSAGAGLVTSVLLLGTVVAELAAPILMRRYGYWAMLVAGVLLLGVPALALLSGGSLVIIVTVSVVRGFGFGLAGMATVVGMTAATALVPLAVFPWLSGRADRRSAEARRTGTGRPDGLLAGLRQAGQLRPFLIFAASTVAGGVVVSFLPLATGVSGNVAAAGLLVQALTATVSRWWAGRRGDRTGHARLLVPALVIASLGMITMIWLASPAAVIAGMFLFGTGFGIAQNATFALMIGRMPASGLGTASALWNLAYDAGYGAGPALFGLLVNHTGYPAAFALTAVLMLAALPAARREHSAGSNRPPRAVSR